MNTSTIKIGLGIPTNRGLRPKMAQSALELVAKNKHYDWEIIVAEHGYGIDENRNFIATQALNRNCDYLLFVDDDMLFEPSLIDQLIADKKDVVGVAYHPRCDMGEKLKWLDETHYISLEKSTDPKYKSTFECHATGTGIVLIDCKVFRGTPRPWFAFEHYPTGQIKLGEDWFFSREAKKAGFKIWTNPKPKIGHIGEKVY